MRTYQYTDHFGDTLTVAFARGEHGAFGNTCVVMCTVEGGGLEPWADVSINVEPMADSHLVAVDTVAMPGLDAWLVEEGRALDCHTPVRSGRDAYPVVLLRDEFLEGMAEI